MIASFFVNAGVIFLLVYSTILLSSQIFISLGDAVPVLARYFAGSLVCRGIMEFELRGMREAGTSMWGGLSNSVGFEARLSYNLVPCFSII